ncbi:MAG: putative CheY-like response regulator [Elusimicrobia bacterium]|nr:MAG: putative CheY-like response regulator [Elusimicrobiota bacterium]KAF0154207.1 MAG: putative CheY-like response regulator [Elusimicrobiota bacterium]
MARILVIDDDGIARDALGAFLIRMGHEAHAAADGAGGLAMFRALAPDLVILDRELPALTGSQVLAKIRETSPSAPVVILTGYDAPEDEARYLAGGATRFLSKGSGLSPVLKAVEELLGPAPAASARTAEARPTAKRRVLVADDDDFIRALLKRFLSGEGYEVALAADGGEAVSLYASFRPDVLLLDIYMPVRDGVGVLEEVLAADPAASVMMITGNQDEELARRCLELGAFDYIAKPLKLDMLSVSLKARLLSAGDGAGPA